MFYTNIMALKLLDHLIEFCLGLHTVDDVEILQLMKTLFNNADGILQSINVMEAAKWNYKRAKLEIQDKYMHAVALKSLLKPGEYETETREWSKLPDNQKNGRRGKWCSGRRMWRSNVPKLSEKERSNHLVVPQRTHNMIRCADKREHILLCQTHCKIRCWIHSRDNLTILLPLQHMRSQMELHLRNCLQVYQYQ